MIPVSEHLTEWPKGRRGLHWLTVKRTQSIIQGKAWMLGLHIRWGGACSRACCILMYQEASWVGSRAFLYNFNQAPMALLLTARTLCKRFHTSQKIPPTGDKVFKGTLYIWVTCLTMKILQREVYQWQIHSTDPHQSTDSAFLSKTLQASMLPFSLQ